MIPVAGSNGMLWFPFYRDGVNDTAFPCRYQQVKARASPHGEGHLYDEEMAFRIQ